AEAIKKVADAEASRVKMVYDALKNANIDEAMLSVKYVEALNEMAKGDNKVFIPYESQGLLGSIGAIKELLADKK
ncbi:MAG: SPFH/Band 7/PHB domain protein, partial [Paeniclostridium sordellii]|nr:SPFH/Band 7/PHB domain protein [Paeniclostridium sordellii]